MSLTGKCPIPPDRTFAPWQRILKGLEEIENAPADDHIVVETHKATHLDRQTDRLLIIVYLFIDISQYSLF